MQCGKMIHAKNTTMDSIVFKIEDLEKLEDPLLPKKFLVPLRVARTDRMIILQMVYLLLMGGEKGEVLNNNHGSRLGAIIQPHQFKFLGIIPYA